MGRELHRAVWGRVGAAVIPLVVGRLFDHWLQTRTSAEPEKHRNKMFKYNIRHQYTNYKLLI